MNSIVRNIKPAPDVKASDFRLAMRELVAGVSILTAGRDRDISGMTVTSLTSLSAEPPRVMLGVNRSASSFSLMQRFGFFGVSILNASQRHVAERFSDQTLKGAERFAGADWITLASGVPVLQQALVSIDCEIEEMIERHSHAIVIGRLLDLRLATGERGLVYWHGQYDSIGSKPPADKPADPALSPRALWQI